MTTAADGFVWHPTPEVARRSRIGRFMRAHGIATLAELQRRSLADLDWYWDAVVRDLGVRWTAPYSRVLDDSNGIAWPTWFPGGRLNLTDNCLDRHLRCRPRGQAGDRLGRRRRPLTHAHLRGARRPR